MGLAKELPIVDFSKIDFIWSNRSIDRQVLYYRNASNFKKTEITAKTPRRRPEIPVWEKSNLTIDEATVYFNIGKDKLRELTDREDCPFVLWIGTKRLIRKKKFEDYLDKAFSI